MKEKTNEFREVRERDFQYAVDQSLRNRDFLAESTRGKLLFLPEHLSKINSSDKILIHSAAGGVGLAAIQIAKKAGATIFATAMG